MTNTKRVLGSSFRRSRLLVELEVGPGIPAGAVRKALIELLAEQPIEFWRRNGIVPSTVRVRTYTRLYAKALMEDGE